MMKCQRLRNFHISRSFEATQQRFPYFKSQKQGLSILVRKVEEIRIKIIIHFEIPHTGTIRCPFRSLGLRDEVSDAVSFPAEGAHISRMYTQRPTYL